MTASAPIVTLIVPGRDIAAFAPAALDSLRAQTESRWRAILIDDGSTDETGAIFAAAAADDRRFTSIRHEASRGLGAARNVGLDQVSTPYLGFLDADDELLPDALARLTGTLAQTGSDFVAGAYVRSRPHGGGYVAGGLGATLMTPSASGLSSEVRPSASLAIGYEYPFNPSLALRAEVRGFLTLIDSSGGFFCSGGCIVTLQGDALVQAQALLGLSLRF